MIIYAFYDCGYFCCCRAFAGVSTQICHSNSPPRESGGNWGRYFLTQINGFLQFCLGGKMLLLFFSTSRGPLLPIGGGCWWWWSEWFYFNLISIYCTFKKLFFTPGTLPPRFPQRRGRLFLDQTWRHHLSVGRRTGKMWPPTLVINIYWRDYCYWLPRAWG